MISYCADGIIQGANSSYAVYEHSPQSLQSYPDPPETVQGPLIYPQHTSWQVVGVF